MKMIGYKGFDKDFKCRDFQFEVGKEYEHDGEVKLCKSGFHFCENPQGVFGHYPPGNGSRFAIVEADGVSDERESDSKRVAKKLKIKSEISVFEMCRIAVEVFFENFGFKKKIEKANDAGDGSALQGGYGSALQGGNYSALQGGNGSALRGGNYSALQGGYYSALRAGDYSALRGGNYSALQGGDGSALQGGYYSALQGGNYSALQGGNGSALQGGNGSALQGGNYSALQGGNGSALQGGNYSALQGGYYSALRAGDGSALQGGDGSSAEVGRFGVAVTGNSGRVKGKKGSVLVARQIEYNNRTNEYKVVDWACALVDGETIKEDTWYVLKDGKLVEEQQ